MSGSFQVDGYYIIWYNLSFASSLTRRSASQAVVRVQVLTIEVLKFGNQKVIEISPHMAET